MFINTYSTKKCWNLVQDFSESSQLRSNLRARPTSYGNHFIHTDPWPHKWKTGYYCFILSACNALCILCSDYSAHVRCFLEHSLEHLRLYLWVMSNTFNVHNYIVVAAFLHVVCIICGSCWWLAYLLLVVLHLIYRFPWLWVSTLNRLSLLNTPSSAKLAMVCHKLIVICGLVVINIHCQ